MTEEKPLIYIIDDDPSVRIALERLLRAGGYGVKSFASAVEFMDYVPYDAPACLVLDIKMPGLSGLELQQLLAGREIFIPIVFITAHGKVPDSVKALKAGALDFLEKPLKEHELLEAVSRGIERHRILKKQNKQVDLLTARLNTLTSREREVFKLIVSGMLNKQVAYDLGISEKTVKVHRTQVMQKMKAQSFADLVRFGETLGIRSSIP